MNDRRPRSSIPQSARGYAMEGDGFYVWDEDAREARLTGEELHRVLEGQRSSRPGSSGHAVPDSPT